jgi:hypothetical protein
MMMMPHNLKPPRMSADAVRKTAFSIDDAIAQSSQGAVKFTKTEAVWLRRAMLDFADRLDLDE